MGYFISGVDTMKKYGLLPIQMYHIIYSGKITVYDYSGNLLDGEGLQNLGNKIYHVVMISYCDSIGIVGPGESALAMVTMNDRVKQIMEQIDIETTRQRFYLYIGFASEEIETYIKNTLPDFYKHYQQEQKKIMDNKQKSVSQQAHIEKHKTLQML